MVEFMFYDAIVFFVGFIMFHLSADYQDEHIGYVIATALGAFMFLGAMVTWFVVGILDCFGVIAW